MLQKILHEDKIEIFSNKRLVEIIKNKKEYSPIVGLVKVFLNGKLDEVGTVDGFLTNMVIATGREFVAQALTKKYDTRSLFGNISEYKIDAFGIGKGGSRIMENETLTLLGPSLGDKGCYDPISLNSQCLNYMNNDGVSKEKIVKFIMNPGPGNIAGSIEFESSQNNEFTSLPQQYFSVIKFTCIVDNAEPTNLNEGDYVKIDEAMLYLTSSTNIDPKPFAHICFPLKFKTPEDILTIEWFIIC